MNKEERFIQIIDMEDNSRKRLYDKLSESYNLGTFEEFDSKMGNDSSRRALYDKVTEKYDIGTFEEFNAKMGNTHKQNLDAFNSQYGSFMNDFESRDTAETKMSRAGMSSGLVVPTEGSISGEERQKYLELHKQEEALKRAWYNSPDYLAQKDADALLLSQVRDSIDQGRLEFAQANPMIEGYNPSATRGAEADKELQMYETASRIMHDAIKLHNAPSKYDGKNAFVKFGKGSVDTLSDLDFWTAGLTEITDNFGVRDVLNSVQSKLGNLNDLSEEAIEDILSPAEKAVLQAWAINAQEQVNRKDDLARAYQAGQSATESLGFMAEFALTGGVGKATSEGVEAMAKWLGRKVLGSMDEAASATVREMGEKIAKSTVGKYGARLADALAETAGKTLVMPSTFRNISEKAAEIQEDAEGNRYLTRMNDAFAKGFTDSFIENLSEGGRVNALGDLIGDVAGKIPAYKKIVDKFANSKAGELLTAFNGSDIMNTLRAGGWHGFGEEYLEEWYGNALRTITGLDKDALKDFATVDNQLITITSFLPMTIFGGTISTAQVLSAKKGLDKKAEMLRSALLERGYDEKQADNMIDMMRGASPAEISQTLTPIINAVALRDLNEAAALMKPVGEFAEAVRRWQSFDTKYQYQEQEQRDNLRTQMEETLGQFWQEDENGRQTVQRGVNANGEVVYLLGKPSAADAQSGTPQQVAAITSDGRKVFVDPSAVRIEGELEMNDFLGNEIMAEKGNKEQARMVEEKERAIAQVRQMSAPGTTVNLGTTEAPVVGTVTQRTPDGVVITMQDGTARQVSYEELGNYVGVNTTPLTDAQMDERDADALSADRAQREAELDMEYENLGSSESELTEAEAEVEQAVEAATPLPTKADGSVDQTALWNTDPARWAQWNDEQRQDGGAHTASFLLKNIQKLRNDIIALNAEREANLDPEAEAQFDAQIDAARDRMASLINVFEKYVPSDIAQQMILGEQTMPTQTGTAPATASEQTAPRVTSQMSEQERVQSDAQHQARLERAKSAAARREAMQNYIDEISQGSTPMTLISVDEYEQQMKDAGCSPNQIAQVKAALAYAKRSNKQIPAFFVPRVGIFAFIENIPNIEQLRLTYIHERQHQFTAANKAHINALLQLGLSRERMAEIVFALSDSDFYKNDTTEALADEIISYAMERAYTYEDFSVALRELGIEQEIIDIITNIDNEQRSDNTTYPSRRRRGYDLHDNSGRQGNRTENDRNQESISGGLLDEQRDRSLGLGDRRTGSGEEGAESGEVISDDEEELNTSDVPESPDEVAEQGTIMDMANQDDSGIRFSIKTEDYLEEQIRAYANSAEGKKAGWTEEKIESIIKETRDLINAIHNSNSGNEFYDDFAVKDPTIRLDWRDGVDKPIVTWTRANIEYKYDMSADLLCINNEGLEAVLSSDKMVALMEMFIPEKKAKKGEPVIKFTADDYLELYNTLKDLGFVVPCKGCFDAAGRFKMLPSVAQKFAAEVNAVIAERNKDPKKFDEKLKAQSGEKTASGLPATSATKSAAIAVGVAGDNLTEPIKWTQLMSADGQTKMLSDWGGIFRAWQRTGAGRPKDKLLPEPYYGDIVSSHTTIIGAYGESTPSFRDILVNTGTGLRRNSHSEFRPVLAVDEIQFMRDAFIRNLTVFKYMKELDDVRLFGKMGVKYNMSFFPEFVPGTKAAGLDLEGNYIASEESVGSREFPYLDERGVKHYDGMKGFEEAQKHINKDVSLSSVILSIPHLLKALTDVPTPSDARGVWGSLIPFHSSGATTSSLAAQGLGLARANGVGHGFEEAMYDYGKGVTNFEAVQNDRFGKGWEIISGKKAGTKVEEGHKLEFANGTHYYNRDLGVHLFASGYILDSELPEGALMENGDLNIDAEQKKALMHKFKVDYNDKVRDLGTPYAYKEAADFYLSELPKIGLIPRFDFTVEESVFLQMCADANVDPRHPKLGWKGEGHGWSPIDSEAYYSLFCDFGMTDPATGEWSPHNPVGVVNENGEREFRLPEDTVEIVREGLERFSEVRRTESGKIDEAIRSFAERSVEKGRISKEDAEKVVGELRMRVSAPSGAIDLVEEARKADLRHRMSSENTLVPGHKKGQPMLSDAEMMTEAVSFRITKNTRATIESWCDKAGLDEDIKIGFVDHLEFTFDDATEQLCAAKWYLSGKINLPNEDEYKVRDAVKVAKRNKVDALSYESPMDILNTFGQPKEKVKPINPDNVPTLKNRTEVPGTDIVIYDVEESEESRENMREIINTHYGKNASPWCLLQGNEEGKLTKQSAEYWQRYSAYPKKVAFKGGRLLAFSANSSKEITWWDRQDHPYNNIPVTQSLNDEKKRKQTVEVNPKTGKEVRRSNIFSIANEDGYTIRRNWDKIDGPMVSAQKIKDGQVKAHFNRYTKDDFATAAQYLLFGRPKGLDQVYSEEKSYAFGYNGALEFYNTLGYKVSYTKEAINPWSIITKDSVIKEYTFNKRGKLVSFFDGSKTIKDRKSLAEVEVPAEFQEIVSRDPKSFMADAEQLIIDAGLADAYKESQSDVSFRITPEMESIREKAKKDGTFMKAPNGQPTNLTEEQWAMVRTKNFKKWFGDWENDPENASKVVDENGEPMVVYHGTGKEYGFTIFNTNPDNQNLGSHFGTAKAAREFDSKGNHTYEVFLNIRNPWSSSVEDFWTDDEETYAFVIAELANHLASQGNEEAAEIYNKIVAQYPMAKDSETWLKWFETGEGRTYKYMSNQHISLRRLLEIGGYDGWMYENFVEDAGSISWVALSPNQIKSATDNNGEFNPENDDIRFSIIGERGAKNDKTQEGLARLANLEIARQMESELNPDWSAKNDENALKIKVATGWERGADGKWRYEVDDVSIKPAKEWLMSKKKLTLKDIIEPNPIFDVYPELLDIAIVKDKSKYNLGAWYDETSKQMKLPFGALKEEYEAMMSYYGEEQTEGNFAKYWRVMQGDFLHELQHAIQHKEGFAKGGHPDMLLPEDMKEYDRLYQEMSDIIKTYNSIPRSDRGMAYAVYTRSQAERAKNRVTAYIRRNKIGKEGYKRLAGEVESRNVETRSRMSDSEKQNSLLASTEDVAREDQIFIMNAIEGEESSVRFRFTPRSEEQREKLFADAKAKYGVTKNFNAAGYMLPDGSLLDFSEANDGGDPNSRSLDHRDIEGIIMDNGVEYDSRWMYIADFMNEGAIRLLPESAGINMIQAPTEEQRKKIFDFIYKYNGEVILEINDERLNSIAYMEYDRRTSPSRIFRDIDGYFNDGIVPQQDVRFRVVDTTKAELKDKPIKMNGMYRFKLKSAFKGIKDSSGQFGYTRAAIRVGNEKMEDPYVVRFDGTLEGYAVIYVRPDLAKITEDKEKEHTFYIDPTPIKDALWEALKAAENYYEAKYAQGPWAKSKNPGPFGYFDWQNADKDSESSIRFRMSNENQAIFVSNAAKAVEGIKQEKATPEQWLKMLEKAGGLKAGEDKWMGLSDWLKASDKKTLTKAEVLDFINENMIVIEEQHYGEFDYQDAAEALGEKYPNYYRAFDFEYDDYREEPKAFINNEDEAAELYNANHEDQVVFDEEEGLSPEDWEKVEAFGAELAKFYYGIRGADVKPINDTRAALTTSKLTNLHEIALTVPAIEPWEREDELHFGDAGEGRAVAWIRFGDTQITEEGSLLEYEPKNDVEREIKDYIELGMTKWGYPFEECVGYAYNQITDAPQESVGWTEEAVTAVADGMRGTARVRKILVIDEIQSNRHQEGREKGYTTRAKIAEHNTEHERLREEAKKATSELFDFIGSLVAKYPNTEYSIESARGNLGRYSVEDRLKFSELDHKRRDADYVFARHPAVLSGIPDAPFDKNWHELAMKRMLRYAAENGYDVIAWTKGEQQANRYNLSRFVKKISASKQSKDGERIVNIYYRDEYDDYKNLVVDKEGKVIYGDFFGSYLADVVGKEMALQIMNAEDATEFKGEGLKIGGEGMRGFYDKMLPAFMNKYGKKWGVKVEDIDLSNLKDGLTMHSVPVTEEMKASVMEGQVMFRMRGENESARDFVQSVTSEMQYAYPSIPTINVEDVTPEVAKKYGYTFDELKETSGLYLVDDKLIIIFAHEDIENEYQVKGSVYHESTHWVIKTSKLSTRIGKFFWDNADRTEFFKELKDFISETYDEKDWHEEMMCFVLSGVMIDGAINETKVALPQDLRDDFSIILNNIGYGRERKRSRITWKNTPAKDGGKSTTEKGMGLETDKGQWNIEKGLTAEERRIINEYFPGAFPEEVNEEQSDNTGAFSEGEGDIRYRVVTDPAKIEELENGPKIKVYRAMQLIDGKLYPPMSAKVDGQLREPIELGQWEEAEERPDLADNKGYFKLDKGNKKSLKARYNPYFHTSYTPLNDQFSEAQDRPNLVIVEVEIPASELTSGYKADKAKDSVGEKEWKAGVIQGKLSGTRKVILSRWDKPIRIVPDSEVADEIVKMFEGKDIVMPSNVVTPSLRAELEKRGVPFVETDNQGKKLTNIAEMTTPIWSSKGTFANLEEAEKWAKENLQGKSKVNRYTGERISIGANSISKMLSPKAQKQSSSVSAHLAALKSVLDFIQTGIPAEVHADQEGRDFDVLRLYNAIEIDNKLYRVKSTVRKVRQGDKFYTYEVQEMELIEERWSSQKGEADNPRNPDSPINSITGAKLLKGVKKSNSKEGILPESENISLRVTGTPTEDVVASGLDLTPAQTAELAGNIFAALPEESRKKITDGLNGNILGLQDAILQIPTSLATKEEWNDEDRQIAEVVAEQMTKAVGKEMTRPFSTYEALWTLYNAVNKTTDLVSEASRALVRRNLGFDSQTLEMEKAAEDGVRFRTVGDASANAQASMYNRGAANVWTRLKESFVDMNASVEELVNAIEKASGKKAEGFENILMALNQQSSKGLAAMEAYELKFLNKMFNEIREIMNKTDFKYEDIVRYVILKHGLERNEKMAQRDAREFYRAEFEQKVASINADQSLSDAQKQALIAAAQQELDSHLTDIDWKIDAKFMEFRERDYSGISSMFYDTLGVSRKDYATEEEYQAALMQAKQDKYATLADIEAAAMREVANFETLVNTDNLWDSINKATKEILRQQYEANMISKDQYETLRDMYQFYVPLRGFADNTAEDMYTYYRQPNSTGYTKPILGAEGRKTEAESPFGWIAAMAGSAIASNVKNEAKLALYYFVANRPDNGIATLSRTWYEFSHTDPATGKKVFKPAYPPFTDDLSSDAAKAAYEQWQEDMRQKRAAGLAYESGQRLNLGNAVVNISDTNKPEHIVNVKIGGKDYTIIINGNPRAAQAINGDLNIESSSQDYSSLFGPVLRWMSSVNTSYNPEFWITNMMRDMAFTLMAVNIKEDPAYRRKFKKNYMKAFKVISMVAKNEKGTLGSKYLEQMYQEFVKYGGVTGYTQIKDNETWEKEIENYLKSNAPGSLRNGKIMKGTKRFFHGAHRFGESLEQISRFAAFLTSREMGKSTPEAINDAKEITVNFNRKGSGKMITLEEAKYLTDRNGQPLNKFEQWMAVGLSSIAPLGRRFIMFFNAAIQGLNATYKLWKKNKARSIGWALGYMAVGVMNAVVHAMMDDDDDYLDMPQYERRNSLMLGFNGVYVKWALPQEARAFYALGDLAVESIMGRNPHQNVVGEALKISTEILPINPSEGWKAFMPSAAIPAVELLLNEDYKGDPIYNEQKWLSEEERSRTAKWSKAYQGTGKLYVNIAKGLNAVTGGDEHDAGLINLQPEKMEHIVQSAFGGTIRTADKFVSSILAAIDPEEDVTMRQFPFINRILTLNDERFKNVHVNDVYDYYAAEAEHALSLQKQYTKGRDSKALKDLKASDEFKWARIYSKYKKSIKKYQDAIKAADTTKERMDLMKKQDEIKRKMIKEISDL